MKSKIILFLSIVSLVSINLFAQDLEPTDEAINEFLSNPAENAIFEIPVLMISYYPTLDGVNLDKEISGSSLTIDEMKMKVDSMSTRAKFMLEEGSKFRGYKNPDAIPSVGYKVIKNIAVYEKMPRGYEVPWNDGWYRPDYNQILERFNAKDFVENLGVKEIWIWGYHHGDIEPAESNMSSPITGDISNSERNEDDLPVYTKSYTVYNYNYNRSQAEAVHNHGHQFEAILTHINKEQDDNSKLFWNLFVGKNEADEFTGGRCGWTHMPPNTTKHYDYLNPAWVESDIENWLPDGSGEKKKVSVETWKNLDYNWVYGDMNFKQKTESQFYIYWFQSFPGYENNIPYENTVLTNWWILVGDWDYAVSNSVGLYKLELNNNYNQNNELIK